MSVQLCSKKVGIQVHVHWTWTWTLHPKVNSQLSTLNSQLSTLNSNFFTFRQVREVRDTKHTYYNTAIMAAPIVYYAIKVAHIETDDDHPHGSIKNDVRLITTSRNKALEYMGSINRAYGNKPFIFTCKGYNCNLTIEVVNLIDLVDIHRVRVDGADVNPRVYLDTYYDEAVCNANFTDVDKLVYSKKASSLLRIQPSLLSTVGKTLVEIGDRHAPM